MVHQTSRLWKSSLSCSTSNFYEISYADLSSHSRSYSPYGESVSANILWEVNRDRYHLKLVFLSQWTIMKMFAKRLLNFIVFQDLGWVVDASDSALGGVALWQCGNRVSGMEYRISWESGAINRWKYIVWRTIKLTIRISLAQNCEIEDENWEICTEEHNLAQPRRRVQNRSRTRVRRAIG